MPAAALSAIRSTHPAAFRSTVNSSDNRYKNASNIYRVTPASPTGLHPRMTPSPSRHPSENNWFDLPFRCPCTPVILFTKQLQQKDCHAEQDPVRITLPVSFTVILFGMTIFLLQLLRE